LGEMESKLAADEAADAGNEESHIFKWPGRPGGA
jgi:hypothetical protein